MDQRIALPACLAAVTLTAAAAERAQQAANQNPVTFFVTSAGSGKGAGLLYRFAAK